jgi:hypothetical protein
MSFWKEHYDFLRDFFEVGKALKRDPPRRKIVKIEKLTNGNELWTLECGHKLEVTKHRMIAVPCKECGCEEGGAH